MAHRSFSTPAPRADAPSFDIAGVGQLDGQPWKESFRCLPEAPAAAFDDLARSVGTNDKGEQVFDQVSLLRFLRTVLHPDEVDRFIELCRDKNRLVQIQELGDILLWLAEVYGERPTERPSSFAGGPPSTPATSVVDSPSPGPTWAT